MNKGFGKMELPAVVAAGNTDFSLLYTLVGFKGTAMPLFSADGGERGMRGVGPESGASGCNGGSLCSSISLLNNKDI